MLVTVMHTNILPQLYGLKHCDHGYCHFHRCFNLSTVFNTWFLPVTLFAIVLTSNLEWHCHTCSYIYLNAVVLLYKYYYVSDTGASRWFKVCVIANLWMYTITEFVKYLPKIMTCFMYTHVITYLTDMHQSGCLKAAVPNWQSIFLFTLI